MDTSEIGQLRRLPVPELQLGTKLCESFVGSAVTDKHRASNSWDEKRQSHKYQLCKSAAFVVLPTDDAPLPLGND